MHSFGRSKFGHSDLVEEGFHHDIKPENILLFASDDVSQFNGRHTMKLADFGAAKFKKIIPESRKESYKTKSVARGDPEYRAPDYYTNQGSAAKKISRPYDIWSLGCVFLEIVVWAIGIVDLNVGMLHDNDLDKKEDNRHPDMEDYPFWYKDEDGEFYRKWAVNYAIQKLDEHFNNRGAFVLVMDIIRKMLEIDSKKRIRALHLYHDLDQALSQARTDFASGMQYRDVFPRDFVVAFSKHGTEDEGESSEFATRYSELTQIEEEDLTSVDDNLVEEAHDRLVESRHSESDQLDASNSASARKEASAASKDSPEKATRTSYTSARSFMADTPLSEPMIRDQHLIGTGSQYAHRGRTL